MKKKWTPLTVYNNNGIDFLLHGRRKRSGLIVFKTTNATKIGRCSYNFSRELLNLKEQFFLLTNETEG